jgi:hypothetical protein
MKSITSKLVVGMLASLTTMGMTGGAAFAGSVNETEGYSSHDVVVAEQPISKARDKAAYAARDRQRQAGDIMNRPESVAGKVLSRVSYARAAASNVVREAQR